MRVNIKLGLLPLLIFCSVVHASTIDEIMAFLNTSDFPSDLSLVYLSRFLGNVPSLSNYGVDSLSGSEGLGNHLMALYNLGMLSVMFIYVVFYSTQAILSVTKDNRPFLEVLNFWMMLRPMLGLLLILPNASGYSAIQIIALFMIAKGVALADHLWTIVISQADLTSTVIHGYDDSANRKTLIGLAADDVESLFKNAACLSVNPDYKFTVCSNDYNVYCWGLVTNGVNDGSCGKITFKTTGVPKYSYLNVIDSLNQALSSYKYSMGTCEGNAISAECLNMRNALMISTTQLYSSMMNQYNLDRYYDILDVTETISDTHLSQHQQLGWISAGIIISDLLQTPKDGSDVAKLSGGNYKNYIGSDVRTIVESISIPTYATNIVNNLDTDTDFDQFLGLSSNALFESLNISSQGDDNSFAYYIKRSITSFKDAWIESVLSDFVSQNDIDYMEDNANIDGTGGVEASPDDTGASVPKTKGKQTSNTKTNEDNPMVANIKKKRGNNQDITGFCAVRDFTHPYICVDPVSGFLEILFNLSLQTILGIQVYDISLGKDTTFMDISTGGPAEKSFDKKMKYNQTCLAQLKALDDLGVTDSEWVDMFYRSTCYGGYGVYAFFDLGAVENPIHNFRMMGSMLMQSAALYFEQTAYRSIQIVNNLAAAYTGTLIAVNFTGMTVAGVFLGIGDLLAMGKDIPQFAATWPIASQLWTPIGVFIQVVTATIDDMLKTGLALSLAIGNMLVPYGNFIAGVLFSVGALLSIYIGFLPNVLFLAAVIGWFILVIETVLAAPLVAIGVTHPEGHDVLGRADQSVMLLVSVFTRPAAIIFGVVLALLLSHVAIKLVNIAYVVSLSTFMDQFVDIQDLLGLSNRLSRIIQTGAASMGIIIYLYLVMAVIQVCYSAIYSVPDRFMKWVGLPPEQSLAGRMAKQLKSHISGAADKAQSGSVQNSARYQAGVKQFSGSFSPGEGGDGAGGEASSGGGGGGGADSGGAGGGGGSSVQSGSV